MAYLPMISGGGAKGLLLFSVDSAYTWNNNTYIATDSHTDEYDYFIAKVMYDMNSTRPQGIVYVYLEKNQSQWVTVYNGASHTRTFIIDDTGIKSTSTSRADRAIVTELYGFKSALI